MSESNNKPQEWHPDSDTQIISDQTIISPISLRLCCIKIVDFMSKSQTRRSRGEFICSQLDELLAKSVGVITPSVKTLFGLENKAFKNTQNKLKLAVIIADEVRLHLDEKTAGEAKKIALTSVEKWLNSITPQPQGNQPPASQEPATGRELPSELDTEQARKYFARAVAAGLMSEQFEWLATKAQLGYFCYNTYSQPRPLTMLERFFDVKKLSSDITNASITAKRADVRKWRAKQDKEIFFD